MEVDAMIPSVTEALRWDRLDYLDSERSTSHHA